MVATIKSNSNKASQFVDEADMYGNALSIGCEVLFAIGSKLRTGIVIRPTMVTITEKDEDSGDGDETTDDTPRTIERTVQGVLIYNDESANRKMVTRPCEDVCVTE